MIARKRMGPPISIPQGEPGSDFLLFHKLNIFSHYINKKVMADLVIIQGVFKKAVQSICYKKSMNFKNMPK